MTPRDEHGRFRKPTLTEKLNAHVGLINKIAEESGAKVTVYGIHPYQAVRPFADCAAAAEPTHASDCSLHNEPAYPNGECDCTPVVDAERLNEVFRSTHFPYPPFRPQPDMPVFDVSDIMPRSVWKIPPGVLETVILAALGVALVGLAASIYFA